MNFLQNICLQIASYFNWLAGNTEMVSMDKHSRLSTQLTSVKKLLDEANADRRTMREQNSDLIDTNTALKESVELLRTSSKKANSSEPFETLKEETKPQTHFSNRKQII